MSLMNDENLANEHKSLNPKRVLTLITARGGSKGLPRKNILLVGGKPLIAWTILAALDSIAGDNVILSSDDDEIMEIAKTWGCKVPFRRPKEFASDTSSSIDVVFHALDQFPGYDYIVLLQPTSPLRTAADIDAAFDLMLSTGAPSCISVCETDQSPYLMYRIIDQSKVESLLPGGVSASRRQDLKPVYIVNGAIYIARVDWLRKSKNFVEEGSVAYVMPRERSLDIDDADDFDVFRRKVEV
jgi:CMP-N,N'-diacetyllegionaminic acid synthase